MAIKVEKKGSLDLPMYHVSFPGTRYNSVTLYPDEARQLLAELGRVLGVEKPESPTRYRGIRCQEDTE